MFLGHLPAGYLLTKALQDKIQFKPYLWVGLLGSVFPDFDILYFYLVDDRQSLHHSYWIHIPFYWVLITVVSLFVLWLLNKRTYGIAALIFFSNVFLHLLLDTIVGKIEWLFPFSNQSYSLFEVPAVYNFWVYNFLFHWTFLLEIAVIVGAVCLFLRHRRKRD